MKLTTELKLQSYLDGELPERDRRDVTVWLERDPQARALLGELQTARDVLTGNEPVMALPESREFYWSKIERELLRVEREPAGGTSFGLACWLRRLLVPAGSLAMLALAATVLIWPSGGPRSESEYETTLADSGATTYRDHANGVTLVWLSYPATDHEIDYEAPPAGYR
jgi:negative regulator of sigma E activity